MAKSLPQAERSERTRTALLETARELFSVHGYANAATEEIVRRAGVTRGALYYHFSSKAGLFKAVWIAVDQVLQQAIVERMAGGEGDVWQRLEAANGTFFTLAAQPDIQRILYVDGPAVLNKTDWEEVNATGGENVIRQALQVLMEQGYIEEMPLEPLTCLWNGLYADAALYIARATDKETAVAEMVRCVQHLANGLRLHAQFARQEREAGGSKWSWDWWKERLTS